MNRSFVVSLPRNLKGARMVMADSYITYDLCWIIVRSERWREAGGEACVMSLHDNQVLLM